MLNIYNRGKASVGGNQSAMCQKTGRKPANERERILLLDDEPALHPPRRSRNADGGVALQRQQCPTITESEHGAKRAIGSQAGGCGIGHWSDYGAARQACEGGG